MPEGWHQEAAGVPWEQQLPAPHPWSTEPAPPPAPRDQPDSDSFAGASDSAGTREAAASSAGGAAHSAHEQEQGQQQQEQQEGLAGEALPLASEAPPRTEAAAAVPAEAWAPPQSHSPALSAAAAAAAAAVTITTTSTRGDAGAEWQPHDELQTWPPAWPAAASAWEPAPALAPAGPPAAPAAGQAPTAAPPFPVSAPVGEAGDNGTSYFDQLGVSPPAASAGALPWEAAEPAASTGQPAPPTGQPALSTPYRVTTDAASFFDEVGSRGAVARGPPGSEPTAMDLPAPHQPPSSAAEAPELRAAAGPGGQAAGVFSDGYSASDGAIASAAPQPEQEEKQQQQSEQACGQGQQWTDEQGVWWLDSPGGHCLATLPIPVRPAWPLPVCPAVHSRPHTAINPTHSLCLALPSPPVSPDQSRGLEVPHSQNLCSTGPPTDGWRYWWDGQQWQPYQELGRQSTAEVAPTSAGQQQPAGSASGMGIAAAAAGAADVPAALVAGAAEVATQETAAWASSSAAAGVAAAGGTKVAAEAAGPTTKPPLQPDAGLGWGSQPPSAEMPDGPPSQSLPPLCSLDPGPQPLSAAGQQQGPGAQHEQQQQQGRPGSSFLPNEAPAAVAADPAELSAGLNGTAADFGQHSTTEFRAPSTERSGHSTTLTGLSGAPPLAQVAPPTGQQPTVFQSYAPSTQQAHPAQGQPSVFTPPVPGAAQQQEPAHQPGQPWLPQGPTSAGHAAAAAASVSPPKVFLPHGPGQVASPVGLEPWAAQQLAAAQPWQQSQPPSSGGHAAAAAGQPWLPQGTAPPEAAQPFIAAQPAGALGGPTPLQPFEPYGHGQPGQFGAAPGGVWAPAAAGAGPGRSPHGRPGCTFAKLLFGGRVLVMSPEGESGTNTNVGC